MKFVEQQTASGGADGVVGELYRKLCRELLDLSGRSTLVRDKVWRQRNVGGSGSGTAAFTMIEIALSLGIIAFALVAIIGVLPSGLKVQRENREETIINQDAAYLMEAIRSGSKGLDDLTNYVESITVTRGGTITYYTNNLSRPGGLVPLTNGQHIVSLLTTPRIERLPNNTLRLNTVTARVRAVSGNAMDKGRGMTDFAFRYQLTAEVSQMTNVPPGVTLTGADVLKTVNMAQNLYDVRLLLRWPLVPRGRTWDVGRYRRTVRTLVSGELAPTYTNSQPYLYLFQPDQFISYH